MHTAGLIFDSGEVELNPDTQRDGAIWKLAVGANAGKITTRKAKAHSLRQRVKELEEAVEDALNWLGFGNIEEADKVLKAKYNQQTESEG